MKQTVGTAGSKRPYLLLHQCAHLRRPCLDFPAYSTSICALKCRTLELKIDMIPFAPSGRNDDGHESVVGSHVASARIPPILLAAPEGA
jgi:hypothetical protein